MDQAIRNKLRSVVTQCRRLLEESVAQQLQGRYDIYATGKKDEVRAETDAPSATSPTRIGKPAGTSLPTSSTSRPWAPSRGRRWSNWSGRSPSRTSTASAPTR